jgi:ketosteroid isomerase-like protein
MPARADLFDHLGQELHCAAGLTRSRSMIRARIFCACLLMSACATRPQATADTTTALRNRKIVLEVFDAFERRDLATLERYFASDGDVILGMDARKRGGPYGTFKEAAAFPGSLTDVQVTVEHILAEGDKVAIQSLICGNHAAPLLGFPPTGKRLCSRYINLYTLRAGRITSNSVSVYRDQLVRQLEANAAATGGET